MQNIYKQVLKTSGLIIGAIIALFAILVFAIHFFFQDQLVQYAVEQLNNQVDAKINIQSGKLSVLKSFPNVSVEFSGFYAQSANQFQKANALKNDTLLVAGKVRFEFNIIKLVNKEFVLKKIHVKDGRIYLRVARNGSVNYDVFKKSETPDSLASDIQLKNVTLDNCFVNFNHEKSDVVINTYCDKLVFKGKINPNNSQLAISSDMLVYKLSVQNTEYLRNRHLDVDMHLGISDKTNYTFRETEFTLEDMNFYFEGFYSAGEKPFINFEFKGNKLNLSQVYDYLPADIREKLKDYTANGSLSANLVIKGDITEAAAPIISIKFDVDKGSIALRNSSIKLFDVQIGGSFTNGTKRNSRSAVLKIEKFLSKIGTGDFALTAKLTGLENSEVEINGVARLNLNELKEFFKLDTFEIFQGRVEGSYAVSGTIENLNKFKLKDAKNLKYSAQINVSNTEFTYKQSDYSIKDLNGDLFVSDNLDFRNTSFIINENELKLNGRLVNGLRYIFKQAPMAVLEADISSPYIDLSKFFIKGNRKDTSSYSREMLFPEDFGLDVNLSVNEFRLNKFTAKWVRGNLQYKPRMFVLRSISLECLGGRIQGNGAIIQDISKNFIVKGQADISKINIQQTFYTFNNFSQKIISDKNLRGKLSGKVNFSSQWNKYLTFQPDKLVMDADITVANGELVNFEPLYGLSRFISLDELKNIKFSTLKNTIYIKDQQVIIPQMDVNSTAFNISGSGTHTFDNHYQYKVKVLLSEILYGKAKKAKKENEEYGVVEDDGLGRTSIYLSIEGVGSNYKISYDSKSTITVVKESLAKQKRELKEIFHDEFGWFKKDTTLNKPKNDNKIRVQWEDEDSETPTEGTSTKNIKKNTGSDNKVKVEWE
jgi:hypothetical protein